MSGYNFCALRVDYMDIDYVTTDYRTGDTALVHVVNSAKEDYNYTWQHQQCYKCPSFSVVLPPGTNCTQRIQTAYGNVINIGPAASNATLQPCRNSFGDTGEYVLDIQNDGSCEITPLHNPPNSDLPVLYAFLVYIGLALIWIILTKLYRRGLFNKLIQPIKWFFDEEADQKKSNITSNHSGDAATNQAVVNINSNDLFHVQQTNGDIEASTSSDSGTKKDEVHNQTDVDKNPDLKNTSPSGEYGNNNEAASDSLRRLPAGSSAAAVTNDVSGSAAAAAAAAVPAATKKKTRLKSLDAFRGLSLTLMIFINYGGAGYWYFEHAHWNGLTVADTVFPWFIWMMGTSMIFSFKGLINRKTPTRLIVWKIVWRSVKLYAIGLCMGTKGSNDMSTIRIPGILQRFGLVYFAAGLAYLPCAHKVNIQPVRMLSDIILFWPEWLIHAALLIVYLALTFALPVPGCPTGYLGPGGLAEWGAYRYCTGGAAGYADRALFTEKHIYNYPTCKEVYYTSQAFDPEGFFTIIPTVFLCLLGSQAGKIVAFHKTPLRVGVRWFLWAIITGALTLMLCHGTINEGWIPVNKNLWSLSYIFLMSSTSFLLLLILYILIDVTDLWNGAPFIYPGMNSILIYICHSVFSQYFPVSWDMPDWTSHWQALILCCWGTSFWVAVAYILHRKKIYVAL